MSLIEKLQWRYATKKMDSTKSVPQEKVEQIVEAIRLTASSSGLQPYELPIRLFAKRLKRLLGIKLKLSTPLICWFLQPGIPTQQIALINHLI